MPKLNLPFVRHTNTSFETPTARALCHAVDRSIKPSVPMMSLLARAIAQPLSSGRPRLPGAGPALISKLAGYHSTFAPQVSALPAEPIPGADWLGYGYRPFGPLLDWDYASRAPLLVFPDWTSAQYDGRTYAVPSVVSVLKQNGHTTVQSFEQSSVGDTLLKFYTEVAGGIDWRIFGGELKAAFQTALERHWEYRTAMLRCETKLLRITLTNLADAAALLTPEARSDLEAVNSGASHPDEFFDSWGTHFISGIEVGGLYMMYMRFQKTACSSSSEIDAMVDATAFGINASDETKIQTAIQAIDSHGDLAIGVYGGMEMPADATILGLNQWTAAVRAAPAAMSFWGDQMQGLTPIYALVPNGPQRNALKLAFTRYCATRQIVLPGMGSAISSLRVCANKKENRARNAARADGYVLEPHDLNQGAGGDFVFIGKQVQDFAAASRASPVLDLVAVTGSSSVGAPAGYVRHPVDLNKGAGGDYIYLCSTTDASIEPLALPVRDITVESFDSAKSRTFFTDRQLDPVCTPGSGDPLDCNKGAGGKYVYIVMRKA